MRLPSVHKMPLLVEIVCVPSQGTTTLLRSSCKSFRPSPETISLNVMLICGTWGGFALGVTETTVEIGAVASICTVIGVVFDETVFEGSSCWAAKL